VTAFRPPDFVEYNALQDRVKVLEKDLAQARAGCYACEPVAIENERLQARVEALEGVRQAAQVFLDAHDTGDDATTELELLDQSLAATEQGESDAKLDTCAQCGMPVKDSYTGRKDLLCEYHASE